MDRLLSVTVSSQYEGARVITVLKEQLHMSTSLIKHVKRYEGGLRLNGGHIRTVDTVRAGDVIEVNIRDSDETTVVPTDLPLDIVYEDEDILIINKRAGMSVHPSAGNYTETVANSVVHYYLSKGESGIFRAVNRLDKDTSGLMTIAKNAYIHARLGEEIQTGELDRSYMCIVCGDVERDGCVDAPIKRAEESVINRIVASDGHRAVTHYKVKERYGAYTLLEMRLETGRTHQIRVHMAYIGHPLVGDWLYGEEDHDLAHRQMLHSSSLRLVHPISGEKLAFEAEMPRDMRNFIKKILENR